MTTLNPTEQNGNSTRHEEWLLDEAIRGSFPASDPASSSEPGSIVNRRYAEAAARRAGTRVTAVAAALIAVALALGLPGGNAFAQDQAAYEQRSIARFEQQFASLDRGHKGKVSRTEADGSIDFIAAFDDIDINRDDVVTKAELDRFLALRYGTDRKEW